MDRIQFKVNGVLCTVGCEVSSSVMLVDYLRNCQELRGTKYMCREGGCGACIVVATRPDGKCFAVNSCLMSVTSCHNWEITTIEELGNKCKGYGVLQKTLAENDGSQCGFCTPGWIMAMSGLLKSKKDLTMLEIEQSFGSNICRCTGYRAILKSFKKFAKDAPKSEQIVEDIEDLKICDKKNCKNFHRDIQRDADNDDWYMITDDDINDKETIEINLRDLKQWYKVYSLSNLFKIMENANFDSYMLVAGNTAKGAYPIDEYPKTLIDITSVTELKKVVLDQNLIVGAGTTLTEFLEILQSRSKLDGFSYLTKLYDHIMKVAHIPVRNIGSIAGNLMIKHAHDEFPSDIFLLFETVGAQLTIINHLFEQQTVTMQQFLSLDMKGKVILNVLLMPLNYEYQLFTYKLMPRSQNAHAIINAGFIFQLKGENVKTCRIAYGGLSTKFNRASKTEAYLINKCLFLNNVLQKALKILDNEMIVDDHFRYMSVEYRRFVAKSIFYKGLLSLCPASKCFPRYASGATRLHESRQLSQGTQNYKTDQKMWPLNQPIQKVEGMNQCAGETVYTEDIPAYPREVFAAFSLSTVASADIVKIDPCQALKEPGVIAFYSAKDIPGLNSFVPNDVYFYTANEKVLAEDTVYYHGQPIGIIVADSQHTANKASKLIQVTYANEKMPVTDIKVAKKDLNHLVPSGDIIATDKGDDVFKVIKGSNTIYGQYHFTMETLVCVGKPTENGILLRSSTQWLDGTQTMIARALKIDASRIEVHVPNLGGGLGIKMSRSIQSAVACSLVVHKLNRPCRFIQPLTTNFKAVGKRFPCSNDYEVGVNYKGVIQYNNYTLYLDNGHQFNEIIIAIIDLSYSSCYDISRWNYKSFNCFTNTAKNISCRAPGSLEAIAMAENLMERISYELSLDPVAVRLANLDTKKHGTIKDMLAKLSITAEYEKRKCLVDYYNSQNRWKKRGLRYSIAKFDTLGYQKFDVNLSVYHVDGSIIITHGGIEMGQGLNTKAIQICGYLLDVPIEKIQVKYNTSIFSPNSGATWASITCQSITIGLKRCCKDLLERLEPLRVKLENPPWEELIAAAYVEDIDLQVHSYIGLKDSQMYSVYGVALAEVEVDILTGEYEVMRADVLQDMGMSISPRIDVGQVEGAFVMGLGYWTCERLAYNTETGELVTDRTWDYHIPQARDIPLDFRVHFYENPFNNEQIFGAKAIGEPPTTLSVVVTLALREAIAQARKESGIPTTQWFNIDGPWTVEKVCMAAETSTESFKFY